jgi:hypothetical protein
MSNSICGVILAILLLAGCSQESLEAAGRRKSEAIARRDELDRTFPRQMVLCDAETARAYIAERDLRDTFSSYKYVLEEFPGPNWKCPAYDAGVKTP